MKTATPQQELTPMLAQYHHFKEQFRDCLLFFRLGDFYELFYQDAVVGSRELGLVLTSRPAGKGRERIPMCGVPYHSAHNYIHRLISKGYKVAICEQVEPAEKGRGIVKREVTRVITPGTYFERETSGLACVQRRGKEWHVALLNLSVGDFYGARVRGEEIYDLLSKFRVREVVVRKSERVNEEKLRSLGICITYLEDEFFMDGEEDLRRLTGGVSLRSLGFEDDDLAPVLGTAYRYATYTQRSFIPFVRKPKPFVDEGFVRLDIKAVRGLEILESSEGRQEFSLLSVVDRTLTGMGRRRLTFHLLNPYRSRERILEIQESVEGLLKDKGKRERIREILEGMGDIDRLVSKISGGMASPRDMISLKNALFRVSLLKRELEGYGGLLGRLGSELEETEPIAEDIDRILVNDPPLHVKEGGLIRDGVDPDLDELRFVRDNARSLLKEYEERLKRETGIGSLKVGYNRVIGFYIEVTKPNLHLVPENFRRRQTLTNAERFVTEELGLLEEKVLSAQSRINDLEYEIYCRLRERVLSRVEEIGRSASIVGEIDYIQSLAHLAHQKGWTKPRITEEKVLIIEGGKHPVIEQFTDSFVPNDTRMEEGSLVHIITGPNMAGKSSYIRQVALITLLAHTGSFVPAKKATIGLVDGIFTRIGSGDVLALGVSTFMNEMLDVSAVLNLATDRSLIILDEVGRGTSTYDGIALSRSVVEFIAREVGARTLVATHFLELTDLEGEIEVVKNYHMGVKREGDRVVFLYNLLEGASESSFGVEVATMAGLPEKVIQRARSILRDLEGQGIDQKCSVRLESGLGEREKQVLEEIKKTDVATITPLDALLKISEWKRELM